MEVGSLESALSGPAEWSKAPPRSLQVGHAFGTHQIPVNIRSLPNTTTPRRLNPTETTNSARGGDRPRPSGTGQNRFFSGLGKLPNQFPFRLRSQKETSRRLKSAGNRYLGQRKTICKRQRTPGSVCGMPPSRFEMSARAGQIRKPCATRPRRVGVLNQKLFNIAGTFASQGIIEATACPSEILE